MDNGTQESTDIAAVTLPKGLEKTQVIAICEARNKTFQEWWKTKFKAIKDSRKAWKVENNVTPKSSNIFSVPITYGNIETMFARTSDAVFGSDKTVDAIRNDGVEEDTDTKIRVENFQNQEVHIQSQTDGKGKHLVKSALIDGFAIWRSLWKQESKKYSKAFYDDIPNADPSIPPTKVFAGREDTEESHEYWTWEKRIPENCAWEPSTKYSVHNSPWFKDGDMMSLSQLLRMEDEGRIENIEEIKNLVPSSLPNGSKAEGREMIEQYRNGERAHPYSDERVYQVDEWWGSLDWENEDGKTEYGDFHWFIVEGTTIVLFEENPLKPVRIPYHSGPSVIDADQVIGVPAAGATKGLQKLLDQMAGKQADLVGQASNVRTYYGQKSGLSGKHSLSKNLSMVPVTDVTQIKESQPSVAAIGVTQNFMNWLTDMARSTTAANEQSQGIEGADTATEFQGLLAASGTRFKEMADTFGVFHNSQMAQECFWSYKQNMIEGQVFVREGSKSGESRAMLHTDFEGDYTFLPATAQSEQNKERSFDADVKFVTMMVEMMSGGAMERQFDIEKYFTEVMLPKRGIKNGGAYFKEAAMMPQGAPQGMIGPGAPQGAPLPAGPMGDEGAPPQIDMPMAPV